MLLDLVRETAPTATPVTVAQLREQAEIDSTHRDDHLQRCLDAATQHLDGYSGALGRALMVQTWVLYLEQFPAGVIRLPMPPLITVDEITYTDANGDAQLLSGAVYEVITGPRAEIRRAYGRVWPAARCEPRSIAITFTCGHATAAEVPAPIRQWILMSAAGLNAQREDQAIGLTVSPNPAADRLLAPFRVPRF
jgi:uncharacterized phiE125 gp8 family phage protein